MRFAIRPEPSLRQKMADRMYTLIVRRDIDLLEITYGLLMLGWGLQLLMPWSTFSTSPSYQPLAAIMPEWAWGLLMAWGGITKIGAYLLDQRRVRMAATLGAVMLWTFLSVVFGTANPYGTGVVVYPVLAITSAIIFWRLCTHRVEQS